jgi:hypothetical protein
MAKLGLGAVIERTLTITLGANADYGVAMILQAIVLGVISGCRHLSDVVRLGMDDVLIKTQGWNEFPVLTTIIRVLERFGFRHCVELAEVQKQIRRKVWDKKWYGKVTLDFDSSAKSAYGHHEGVARG